MGSTHNALEDYGTLLCLPHLRVYVPAFDADLFAIVEFLFATPHPAYLRLGLSEEPTGVAVPPYSPWRRLLDGRGWVVLVTGPLVGGIWDAVRQLDEAVRPALWLLCELPFDEIPDAFLEDLARSRRLLVVEEHVAQGGIGQIVARKLLELGQAPRRYETRSALGYVSGLYGSQKFHRQECGLDAAAIVRHLAGVA